MPELTKEEVKIIFLKQIKEIVKYWAKTNLETEHDNIEYRCDGVAFSILSLLDGSSVLPGFIVAPYPHEKDRQFQIDQDGEKAEWFPENHESNINCDIAGDLHELYHKI